MLGAKFNMLVFRILHLTTWSRVRVVGSGLLFGADVMLLGVKVDEVPAKFPAPERHCRATSSPDRLGFAKPRKKLVFLSKTIFFLGQMLIP